MRGGFLRLPALVPPVNDLYPYPDLVRLIRRWAGARYAFLRSRRPPAGPLPGEPSTEEVYRLGPA